MSQATSTSDRFSSLAISLMSLPTHLGCLGQRATMIGPRAASACATSSRRRGSCAGSSSLATMAFAAFTFFVGKQHRGDRGAARVVGILVGGDAAALVAGALIMAAAAWTLPQFVCLLDLRCETWTGRFARRPMSRASSMDFEQLVAFVADVAGVDAAVLRRRPWRWRRFRRVGEAAGDVLQAGRHAPGAGLHAGAGEVVHFGEFVGGGWAARGADDFFADGAVRDEMGDVDAGGAGVECGVVLGDVDCAAAAIAGDERGAALREIAGRLAGFVGENLALVRFVGIAACGIFVEGGVAVIVEIDEAGGDDQSAAVDGATDLAVLELADGDDLVADDRRRRRLCLTNQCRASRCRR